MYCIIFKQYQLMAAFAQSKKQGKQNSTKKKPGREAHLYYFRTGDNPQKKTGSYWKYIDYNNMFEKGWIADLQQ